MSGKAGEQRWSTRQRLVVLTFDTPEAANEWDTHPANVKPWLTLPLTWDESTMGVLIAARDVIDEWHDLGATSRLGDLVERLRVAVFDMSQSGRLRVVK